MKVKEQDQKEQEKMFKENLSFQEWLNYFCKKPTNNKNYQPKCGA